MTRVVLNYLMYVLMHVKNMHVSEYELRISYWKHNLFISLLIDLKINGEIEKDDIR